MPIEERRVGSVIVLDAKGNLALGAGDLLLKDKIHGLVHQGHTQVVLNLPVRSAELSGPFLRVLGFRGSNVPVEQHIRRRPWCWPSVIIAASLSVSATAGLASAQTTRADTIRAEREAKEGELAPHARSLVERVLFKIDDRLLVERLLSPPRGFHLRLGGIGEGAGFGVGPAFRRNTEALDLRASAAASFKRYVIGEASVRFPGTPLDSLFVTRKGPYVEFYARRRDFPQEDFFGLGPDSKEGARSNFAMRDSFARVTGGFQSHRVRAGVSLGYLDPSVGRGTDSRMPSTGDIFAPTDVPGLAVQPAFSVIEPFIEVDTTNRALNEPAGGRYRFALTRYGDRDLDQFSFRRWDLDVRQFMPFFSGTRTIALRGLVSAADPNAGDRVPFFLQPTLGGATTLRGFRSFRFRDRSALLLQAEYRWRINELVTGALFYDTGAVAPRLGDLGRLERDYGFGLRAGGRNSVAVRVDMAVGGREGARLLVRFDDVF